MLNFLLEKNNVKLRNNGKIKFVPNCSNGDYENYQYKGFADLFSFISPISFLNINDVPNETQQKFFYLITPLGNSNFLDNFIERISNEYKTLIQKHPNVFLLIWFPRETNNCNNNVFKNKLFYKLKENDIPFRKVILITGELENKKDNIPIIQKNIIIFDFVAYHNLWYTGNIISKNDIRDNYFLHLIRKPKKFRINLLRKLLEYDNINNIYTLSGSDDCNLPVPLELKRSYHDYNVDIGCFEPYHIPLDLFNKCYIQIVHESFQNSIFLTEKTFKPILAKQMFFTNGCYNQSKNLKKIGYETFDDILDYYYDIIKDHELRQNYLLENLKKLLKKDKTTMHNLWLQNQEKIEHNYNHIQKRSKPENMYNRIVNVLYN